jgi:hypothetical protein
MRSASYRGWKISYSATRSVTGVYVAESHGVTLSAHNRVDIERVVDQRIRDYPPNGHGASFTPTPTK